MTVPYNRWSDLPAKQGPRPLFVHSGMLNEYGQGKFVGLLLDEANPHPGSITNVVTFVETYRKGIVTVALGFQFDPPPILREAAFLWWADMQARHDAGEPPDTLFMRNKIQAPKPPAPQLQRRLF